MCGRSKLGWGDLCGLSELDRNSAANAPADVFSLGLGVISCRNRGEPKKGTPGNTFFFLEKGDLQKHQKTNFLHVSFFFWKG